MSLLVLLKKLVKTLLNIKGDRVVVNPTVSKHEKDESVDLYDGYSFIGLGSDGGFAEFTNAPEENVYALPESVSDKEGALVDLPQLRFKQLKKVNYYLVIQ